MRLLFTIFSFCLCSRVFAQPDPNLELDKKNKAAYFKQLRDDAFTNWVNCSKQCGSHAADANNPDPCSKSDPINVCLCACATKYQGAVSNIGKQEQDWLRTAAQKQKDYETKKIKEQQDVLNEQNKDEQRQNFQTQQQVNTKQKLNKVQQQLDEQQQRYQRMQLEFGNAQTAADDAYQIAIASGKKESGAIVDATLAGANQISDPTGQLVYTGVGLATSLLMHFGEKKQERLQKEEELKREQGWKTMVITSKEKFIKDALNINQYGFSDLISKERYAAILIIPKNMGAENQDIYFTILVKVPMYSDSTFPLKDEIEKKLLSSLNKSIISGKKIYTLYPVIYIDKFQNDFVKKMGSGHLIFLNAHLLNFLKNPFIEMQNTEHKDFWGNPIKESVKPVNKKDSSTIKNKNSFWDN